MASNLGLVKRRQGNSRERSTSNRAEGKRFSYKMLRTMFATYKKSHKHLWFQRLAVLRACAMQPGINNKNQFRDALVRRHSIMWISLLSFFRIHCCSILKCTRMRLAYTSSTCYCNRVIPSPCICTAWDLFLFLMIGVLCTFLSSLSHICPIALFVYIAVYPIYYRLVFRRFTFHSSRFQTCTQSISSLCLLYVYEANAFRKYDLFYSLPMS